MSETTDEQTNGGGLTIEGPFVEKTAEGSYYEAYLLVNGARFPIAVMKSGELEARVNESAAAARTQD